MIDAFILLGSNRGDRETFLLKALGMIKEKAGIIKAASRIYETEPWGFQDPEPFLNQVIRLETALSANLLLDQLLTIEVQLGRIRPFDGCGCSVPSFPAGDPQSGKAVQASYSGRTIDLDILFYGQQMVFTDNLMVPHPRLHERMFTLVPLHEIAPDVIHPVLKKTVSVLLAECRDKSVVRVFNR